MKSSSRDLDRIAVVFLVASAVAACTRTETTYVDEPIPPSAITAPSGDGRPSADSGLGVLTFRPSALHSGFDGTHAFTVPIAVYDSADDLQLTASDPAAVSIAPKKLVNPLVDGIPDSGKYFFVTMKRSGTFTLRAASRGETREATVTVVEYPADRWRTGETRYKNGGGGDPPCTECHVAGKSIDHSPSALATVNDDGVAAIITTGVSSAGLPIRIDGVARHQWQVSDAEREGLITYLRSLEPRGFQ